MAINGKPGKVEKVDETTVRFVFPEPYYLSRTCWRAPRRSPATRSQGSTSCGCFAPGHYLKQFLPKFAGQEKRRQDHQGGRLRQLGQPLKFKNDWALNPELPVVAPWKSTQPINTPTWTLERNPYSIWVDTEGNQLPYIDKIQMTLAENLEVLNLRAIAGEYDMQERHVDVGQDAGLPGEPAAGQLQALPGHGRLRRRLLHQVQPELRGRPGDRQVAHQRRLPASALAGDRPRPDQRDVLARARDAGLGRADRDQQVQPRPGVPRPSGTPST